MHFRLLAALMLLSAVAHAQRYPVNPFAKDPAAALAKGEKLYGARCAVCHGKDGRGGEGPSLAKSRIVVLLPDHRFFEVVKFGIPGTEMPPMPGPDEAVWQVVTYVHSIAKPGAGPRVPGDVEAGRKLFDTAGCRNCHMVGGKGGVLGPDLSSIAVQSSTGEIKESILKPDAKVAPGYQGIVVTCKDGSRLEGTLKNEDNFSVQLMTRKGELMALRRSEIASLQRSSGSLMPSAPGAKLPPEELQNLLAFLDQQRVPVLRRQIGFQNY